MKKTSPIIGGLCVLALAVCSPLSVSGKEKKAHASPTASPSSTTSEAAGAAERPIGFRGTVTAVDQSAKTITLSGKTARVLKVTDQTAVTKDGNTASISDINANDKISGSYWKQADGSMEAKTLTIGKKAEKAKKKSKEKEEDASASPSATP